MTRLVDMACATGCHAGRDRGGKDMVRDAKYFRLACRICAELGAQC